MAEEHKRPRRFPEPANLGVARHAHDPRLAGVVDAHGAPHRISLRKEAPYELLVHQSDRLTVHDVGGVEAAARDEPDSNRCQELIIDPAHIDPVAGIANPALRGRPQGGPDGGVRAGEGGATTAQRRLIDASRN